MPCRSKITFIAWSPDNASLMVRPLTHIEPSAIGTALMEWKQPKMMYSSSKDALKRALNGLAADIQANDEDDIEYESIISRVSKGR